MNGLLAVLPRENDWISLLWVLLFVGFPLVARLVRALMARAGLASAEPGTEARSPLERHRRRVEQRRSEEEGEDQWRRLAEGEEVSSPPPEPPPARAPEAPVSRPKASKFESKAFADLRDISEPGVLPSLTVATESAPLALGDIKVQRAKPVAKRREGFRLKRGDMRRAVILSEILGRPVSERPRRA